MTVQAATGRPFGQQQTSPTHPSMGGFHRPPIDEQVLRLCNGTSSKCVPDPNIDEMRSDAVLGLRDFINKCRWKEHIRPMKEKNIVASNNKDKTCNCRTFPTTTNQQDPSNPLRTKQHTFESTTTELTNHEGLSTNLKPTETNKTAKRGSAQLKKCLSEIERSIIDLTFQLQLPRLSEKDSSTHDSMQNLKKSNLVVAPTDKTNSFRLVDIQKHNKWVAKHLSNNANEISCSTLTKMFQQAKATCNMIAHKLSKNELLFLTQGVVSKAAPTPKSSTKDHKDRDNNGDFPTRLVMPANNCMSRFQCPACNGTKSIPDKHGVQCNKHTMAQACKSKNALEKHNTRRDGSTIITIDVKNMHPSCRMSLSKKVVFHCIKDAPEEGKETARFCPELLLFGMRNTLMMFRDKCHTCKGNSVGDNAGLTIGGCESAFLADLAASCMFEQTTNHFENTKRRGTCGDGGLCIFNGNCTIEEINQWHINFQNQVNKIAEGDFFQFTAEAWGEGDSKKTKIGNATSTTTTNSFPFLGIDMHWDDQGFLQFKVFNKPGQQIEHAEKSSAHTPATLAAIPKGVFKCLARNTSLPPTNANATIDKLCPKHADALQKANLTTTFPTLQQIITEDLKDQKERENKDNKKDPRNVHFLMSMSRFWKAKTHKLITKTLKKHNTNCVRVRMACKRCSNLGEMFNADLSFKTNEDLVSSDFEDRPCNCSSKCLVDGRCACGGRCNAECVTHKATCLKCKSFCIGNTQQPLKKDGGNILGISQDTSTQPSKSTWKKDPTILPTTPRNHPHCLIPQPPPLKPTMEPPPPQPPCVCLAQHPTILAPRPSTVSPPLHPMMWATTMPLLRTKHPKQTAGQNIAPHISAPENVTKNCKPGIKRNDIRQCVVARKPHVIGQILWHSLMQVVHERKMKDTGSLQSSPEKTKLVDQQMFRNTWGLQTQA